jgi:hypothetical protein
MVVDSLCMPRATTIAICCIGSCWGLSAIDCTSIDFGVDLTIEEIEIGAVDERDGRVSEIGVNSLLNHIRSWSKLKRY